MNDSEAGARGSAMAQFDVFLNHRGPDVKTTFVAHLEDALLSAGFRPFLDVKSLRKSNPALQSIDQALAMAKVHVEVVSRGYAESKYCLNELVAMMRSGKPVVPVFYGVEPVDLRWVENGPFAEAFEKHKVRGRSEREVQEWRDALAALAGLTGFRLADYKSDEARLKREVVKEVERLSPSNHPVEVDEYRVGLEGPTHACIEVLRSMGDGIGLLGLVGMGGVGKSTLAREIYNHYAGTSEFRFMTFLEIHRDCSSSDVQVRPRGHKSLREQLLWDILRTQDNGSSYGTLFQRVSTLGLILIVIDDIHSLGQFQELVPSFEVLCPGSRIIVTSRDRSIVYNFIDRASEHYIYELSKMGVKDADMLFNLHAFHSKDAPMDYKDVAKSVVEACGGLPLALKVMESSLFDKKLDGDQETIWVEATDALQASEDVMRVLRWSYERLNECEKLMFMDITCLFDHHSVEEAFAYWKSCKYSRGYVGFISPRTSLRNLVNKNLVSAKGIFEVHGLLREMGQRIAMNAKRHLTNDGFLVDEDKVETIGLNLVGCQKWKFKAEDFGNMSNLLALQLPNGCKLEGDFGCMSKKLRLLQWRCIPMERLPTGLSLSLLTSLDLSFSTKLASIWTESNSMQESFPYLHSLKLARCKSITRLPDSLGQSFQLEHLDLRGCKKLEELPNSINQHKVLKELDLCGCKKLGELPNSIGQLKALKELNLFGCEKLEELSDSIGQLKALKKLDLSGCEKLEELPNSIGQLKGLKELKLQYCSNPKTLPDSIICLELIKLALRGCKSITRLPNSLGQSLQLEHLDLFDCKKLEELPNSIGQLKALKELDLWGCEKLEELPDSIGQLKGLKELKLQYCSNLKTLPDSITCLELIKLELRGCKSITRLPNFLGQSLELEHLDLRGCEKLEELPDFIGQLKALKKLKLQYYSNLKTFLDSIACLELMKLTLNGCESITRLPDSLGQSLQLEHLDLFGCKKLEELPNSIGQLKTLKKLDLFGCEKLEELPNSIGQLKALKELKLQYCSNLKTLPDSITWPELIKLELRECKSITRLPNSLGQSLQLKHLDLFGCEKLEELPDSIGQLKALKKLDLFGCEKLEELLDFISQLKALKELKLQYCSNPKTLPDSIACPELIELALNGCESITRLFDSLGQSLQLEHLHLFGCKKLEELPNSIGQLKALKELNLRGCEKLEELPDSIGQLKGLKELKLQYCSNLKTLPDSITCLELIKLELRGCKSITRLPNSLGQSLQLEHLDLWGCEKLKELPDFISQLKMLKIII